MISCRGNTCIPYMKLHNTSWADPKWRFSTGKESWILQHDPGLSDSSHWTGKAGATLWCWGKLSTSPDPSLRQESNSLPHEASLLQASSPGKAPSSQRGQGSSREGEQEPRRCGCQFLPSWAVGHLFPSVHVQWKDREARGRRDDTRQSSLSDSHLLGVGTGRMSPSCPKLHAVNGSWMLLIRNELLQQQLKPLTCKMWELVTSLKSCRENKEKSDFFFLLKLPGFRETQVGNYSWNCYFHLRALHWSHSQVEITSFFKENGHIVWLCRKWRNWLT